MQIWPNQKVETWSHKPKFTYSKFLFLHVCHYFIFTLESFLENYIVCHVDKMLFFYVMKTVELDTIQSIYTKEKLCFWSCYPSPRGKTKSLQQKKLMSRLVMAIDLCVHPMGARSHWDLGNLDAKSATLGFWPVGPLAHCSGVFFYFFYHGQGWVFCGLCSICFSVWLDWKGWPLVCC